MKINKSYLSTSKSKVYIVPTPIGNLDDITLRALKVLKEVDIIACEDTRVTSKLLNHYEINNKRLVSLYSQKEEDTSIKLLMEIKKNNLSLAYVSDAGTPGISDPGSLLIHNCFLNDIPFSVLPGPCALITGLVSSNIDTADFSFYGFLPTKINQLESFLTNLKYNKETLVFYESPLRIIKTLNVMKEVFGKDRNISLIRELTKIHEEIVNGTIEEIINANLINKGEYIIVVEGNKNKNNSYDIDELIKEELKNNISTSDIAKKIHDLTGISKKIIYNKIVSSEVQNEK